MRIKEQETRLTLQEHDDELLLHSTCRSSGSVDGTAIMLQAGKSWVRIPVEGRDFAPLQTSRPALGFVPPPTEWKRRSYPGLKRSGREVNHGLCVKLITQLHSLPRLRRSGVIPPIPIYALMAWTGKTTTSALHETKILRSTGLFYLYFPYDARF